MRNLREELRWTFTWPMGWLQGVMFNAVLAAAYLVFWPLTGNDHSDVVLLFTTYFATFFGSPAQRRRVPCSSGRH